MSSSKTLAVVWVEVGSWVPHDQVSTLVAFKTFLFVVNLWGDALVS